MANNVPEVSGSINLGISKEDLSVLLTEETLLNNASDLDGDYLSIKKLEIKEGKGVVINNGNGTWSFTPEKDWHGDVSFDYQIFDGSTSFTSKEKQKASPRRSYEEHQIYWSFAALRSDGSVVTWGRPICGGNS